MQLVTHYSLAHCDKSFLLSNEHAALLNVTPVETLQERIYQIFGGDALDRLVELDPAERVLEIAASPAPATRAVQSFRESKTGDARKGVSFARIRFRAASAKAQLELGLYLRQQALDSRQGDSQGDFFGLPQFHAARLLPLCAFVPRSRAGRGRCQRPPIEDRGALPASIVRSRFRARLDSRLSGKDEARIEAAAARGRGGIGCGPAAVRSAAGPRDRRRIFRPAAGTGGAGAARLQRERGHRSCRRLAKNRRAAGKRRG